ncbi:antibiotic biosynthesis monooxygenase family protein [Vibrio sp. RC27]
MFAVVLEFDVIEGMENQFRKAWVETTEIIYQNFGSLGSRLHQSDNGKFIAYAQWPDLSIYESVHHWPCDSKNTREKMRSCLKIGKPTVLHKLTLDSDLLKEKTFIN